MVYLRFCGFPDADQIRAGKANGYYLVKHINYDGVDAAGDVQFTLPFGGVSIAHDTDLRMHERPGRRYILN